MKIILILISIFAFSTVNAEHFGGDWRLQRNTTFADIYKRGTSIDGVVRLSLPKGQQAIVMYVNTAGARGSLLYKCIEYFDEDMNITGNACYVLD